MYWAFFPTYAIRLVSEALRGQGNTPGSLLYFLVLLKLFLQGSVLSLCEKVLLTLSFSVSGFNG